MWLIYATTGRYSIPDGLKRPGSLKISPADWLMDFILNYSADVDLALLSRK